MRHTDMEISVIIFEIERKERGWKNWSRREMAVLVLTRHGHALHSRAWIKGPIVVGAKYYLSKIALESQIRVRFRETECYFMTGFALALVLTAAFAHASWNYLTKRASGGVPFLWLFAGFTGVLYLPIAIGVLCVQKPHLGLSNLGLIVASAIVHSAYFTLLDKAYRLGDLSLVYPLARGTGPLLSATVGIVFLKEHPSRIALMGIGLMIIGIFTLTGNPSELKSRSSRKAVFYGLACGGTIATYTVLDKISVSILGTPPLLLDWGTNFGRFLILTPLALRNFNKVIEQWNLHRKEALGVAILSPLAYILVLTAMTKSPVSYIAPAREVSILIGTIMGARLLSEGNARLRIAGSAAMVLGLVALALG